MTEFFMWNSDQRHRHLCSKIQIGWNRKFAARNQPDLDSTLYPCTWPCPWCAYAYISVRFEIAKFMENFPYLDSISLLRTAATTPHLWTSHLPRPQIQSKTNPRDSKDWMLIPGGIQMLNLAAPFRRRSECAPMPDMPCEAHQLLPHWLQNLEVLSNENRPKLTLSKSRGLREIKWKSRILTI